MKKRRDFLKSAAAAGNDRRYWVSITEKIARPVLENLPADHALKNVRSMALSQLAR